MIPPRAQGQTHHSREGDGTPRRDGEGTHDEHEHGDTNKADSEEDLFTNSNDDTTVPEGTNTEEGADITAVPTIETKEE